MASGDRARSGWRSGTSELRRHRTDELKAGLATVAGTHRDALVAGTAHHPEAAAAGVQDLHGAIEALERNPNEQLLLELFLRLPASEPATPLELR